MRVLYIGIFAFLTIFSAFSLSEVYAAKILDDDYIVEEFAVGLHYPTTMTFVDNDILVLEKTGNIIRIQENGILNKEPVLSLSVLDAIQQEVGLLGITFVSDHVYLFFTEKSSTECSYPDNISSCMNVVYQYDWNENKMINPILIKEFPVTYGYHAGGVFATGLSNEIYFVIGDQDQRGIYQNIPNEENESGSIFKIDTESNNNVELFAIGIRNSFGLAVDPVTGFLWDTENGVYNYDEVNLVKPGFNSGWIAVQGPVDRSNPDLSILLNEEGSELDTKCMTDIAGVTPPNCTLNTKPFENFVYSDPEFSFYDSAGTTGIEFPDKNSFSKYKDWLFVGEFVHGKLYKFQLNADRTGFIFSNPDLSDLVLDDNDEMDEILFGTDFQGVTDIEFHNGAMYVIAYGSRVTGDGSIYKIYPKEPLSPLKQYQNGIATKNIVCKEELMPIMNKLDHTYCVLPKTAINFINMKDWNINHPEMPKIELKNQDLQGLNFEHFHLSYSDFRGSNFGNSNISNANLSRANLSNTDLSGANLSGANLSGANLSGANIDENTILNCIDHPICVN